MASSTPARPMSPDNPFADLIAKPQGISPGNPFADLVPKSSLPPGLTPPSAQTPGAGRTLSALDALMAKYSLGGDAAPVAAPTSALDALAAKYGATPTPTSGVTIAPKGGTAREATVEEAAALNPGASLADVASTAGANLIPSAQRFGTDIWDAVSDPRQTARSLKNVTFGAAEKLLPGEQSHEKYADAVGQFFANRYGGMDAVKKTIAEDPVGFAADVATVLSGGELALARAPGVVGTVARAAGTVGRAVDPINASLKAAGTVARGVGHVGAAIGGVTTGVGGQALRTAARTGFEGGEAGAAFRDNMRGNVPMEDVITEAKSALGNIKQARSAAYNAGMTGVNADTKVLDFSKIDQALDKTKAVKTFKGVSLSPSTDATVQGSPRWLTNGAVLIRRSFTQAAGFDALKQRIGDIRDEGAYGTPQRLVADQVYNTVKNEVVKRAPDYAKTMKRYQQASDLIREMEKTLSLNPKASVDTTLRKLQSVMRDNVNTNYGKRADLVQLLQDSGAKNILAKLAGQSLKSFEPRGLARVTAGLGTIATGAGAAFLNPMSLLPVAGALATQSPRLVGELTHLGGRAANALERLPARNALMAGYQTRGVPNALVNY